MRVTRQELDEKLSLARNAPGIAHLILTGPKYSGIRCELCGGTNAPIIDGRHLNPARFCKGAK